MSSLKEARTWCRSMPTFADVAQKITRDKPPRPWLVTALEKLSHQVEIKVLYESDDPKRAELRARFEWVRDEATKTNRALSAIGFDERFFMTFSEIENIVAARRDLEKLVKGSDRILTTIPSGGGSSKAPRSAGLNSRGICAVIVIEAWTLIHGSSCGANNPWVQEICEDYWLACGYSTPGKYGAPGNWRRAMTKALDDKSPDRQYIRDELRRCGTQSGENFADAVP